MDKEMTGKETGTLANKAVRGAVWIIGASIFNNAQYFLRTVILVRFLNPLDFGLMGIARVVINILERFSETGISPALVQKKDLDETAVNAAWAISALRGFILFVLLYIFSGQLSRFYNNCDLGPILRFISLSFLFTGITSPVIFLFTKELDFKNKVILEQSNAVCNTVVSVVLAVIFRNVWALVIGHVAGIIAMLYLSYGLYSYRPSLKFDLKAVKGLLDFGKYVFASGIVLLLTLRGPDALVGKILGLTSLGYFVIAFSIANTPAVSITHIVSQVVFPLYSKLQEDLNILRKGYLRVLRLVMFMTAPVAGGIFMLIPEFVCIFLGAKWDPIILPVRILCVFGFLRSVAATSGPVFYGIGRPDVELKLNCFNLALLAVFFYPLVSRLGIAGASLAISLMSMGTIFFVMGFVYKLIHLDKERSQFFKSLFFPIAATILMCVAIYVLKSIFARCPLAAFFASILIGGGVYLFILYILDRHYGYGLADTIRSAADSFKKG